MPKINSNHKAKLKIKEFILKNKIGLISLKNS